MLTTPQFRDAMIRAAIGGIVLAGSAFFGVLSGDLSTGQQLGPHAFEIAGVAAGVVFFGNLVVRAGAEGLIDSQAAANGGRRAADKLPTPPSLPTQPPPPAA